MLDFFQRYSEALQALAAVTSIIVLIPSAIIFILNQQAQRALAREENHKYIIEQYRNFLQLCLPFSNLSLESGTPRSDLSRDEHLQRDILFDILTSIFERAFITYSDSRRSDRKLQWQGWDNYIGQYANRPDYLEWWRRHMFHDRPAGFFQPGMSQYDQRFESYMFEKLRNPFMAFERDGTLEKFKLS